MRLEQFRQQRNKVDPAPRDLDKPCLVVDARGDDIHIFSMQGLAFHEQVIFFPPDFDAACDLPMRALHAMAKAHRSHAAVAVAGPGIHCHRVCVVHEHCARLGNRADFPAELEEHGDRALRIHDATRAKCVTHALIHSIFQGNVDIGLKRLQPALPDHAKHVIRALKHCQTVG